ncbi:hypothetical protein MMC10_007160 [Thelotrema lepadinum]|nr:hypothetical protein [Thelotrema lepadinum]
MSRREVDRRDRDRGDRDDYPPSKRQAPRESAASRPKLDEFWLDGDGIDRQVLQSSICRFLGPEATSRPFDLNGKPGFKIKAIRPFTPDMLDDLRSLSQAFVQENRALRGHNREEVRYEDSQTRIRRDLPEGYDPGYGDRGDRYAGAGANSYGAMPGPYSQEQPMAGYPSMYGNPGGQKTSSSYQPASHYSMAPPASIPAYDGRYPQDPYQGYASGPRDLPPNTYGNYSTSTGYAVGPDSRSQMPANYYQGGNQPVPRMAEDPRYGVPYGMPNPQAGGVYPPARDQNSPYDPVPRGYHDNRPNPAEPSYSRRR